MEPQEKFKDFLALDCETMAEYFTIREVKRLLKTEPYNRETLRTIYHFMMDYVQMEEYLWAAMFRDEIKRREDLTIV